VVVKKELAMLDVLATTAWGYVETALKIPVRNAIYPRSAVRQTACAIWIVSAYPLNRVDAATVWSTIRSNNVIKPRVLGGDEFVTT